MDLIEIAGLRLRCVIGCRDEERRDRSDVVIDLRIGTDARLAGDSDDLSGAWDYRAAAKAVISDVEASACFTVEALATRIARTLVTGCQAPYVGVRSASRARSGSLTPPEWSSSGRARISRREMICRERAAVRAGVPGPVRPGRAGTGSAPCPTPTASPGTGNGALFRQRAAWAASRLHDGTLLLPGFYVIFDLDPVTSLTRRAGRLRPGHPWNDPVALRRLRHFYADPGRALRPVHPGLARALRHPGRVDISGHSGPAAAPSGRAVSQERPGDYAARR